MALGKKYQSLMQWQRCYLWHGYYVTSILHMVRWSKCWGNTNSSLH
jgi:hypothetical protein